MSFVLFNLYILGKKLENYSSQKKFTLGHIQTWSRFPWCCYCPSQPNISGVILLHLAMLQRDDSDKCQWELTYLVDPIITHFCVATFDHHQRQQASVCEHHQVIEMNTGWPCEVDSQGMCHERDKQKRMANVCVSLCDEGFLPVHLPLSFSDGRWITFDRL